jgi:hypothetical protein
MKWSHPIYGSIDLLIDIGLSIAAIVPNFQDETFKAGLVW